MNRLAKAELNVLWLKKLSGSSNFKDARSLDRYLRYPPCAKPGLYVSGLRECYSLFFDYLHFSRLIL